MTDTSFGSSDLDPALAAEPSERSESVESGSSPDLGDLVIVLLASTLAGLRDRLRQDGFGDAADFVDYLTDCCDTWLQVVGN